jgi:predicted PurR-regulated permease PerM
MNDISYKSIFKVTLVIGLILLITKIIDILILLFISVILVSAIKPLIQVLDKFKIPKNLATLIIVFGFVGTLAGVLYLGSAPLVGEVSYFASHFGEFVDSISKNYNLSIPNQSETFNFIKNSSGALSDQLGNTSKQIFTIGSSVLNILLSTLALIALTFYQLAEENKVRDFVSSFFGHNASKAKAIINRAEKKLGAWFRGQLSLMIFVGAITYLFLFLFGFRDSSGTIAKFALPLAIIAGSLEIIPVVGPTMALIPAVFVGAAISPWWALIILMTYLGIQQVESNIVIPRVMSKAVGLDPIITILGIIIGNNLMGPIGSLLSVPIMAVGSVLYDELIDKQKT